MYRSKPQYPPHNATNEEVILHAIPGIGGVPWSSDAWGWPDEFNSYRVLDWRSGDGINPLVGNTLTAGGSTSISKSPFTSKLGAISSELFDGTARYYSTQSVGPTDTQDIIVCILGVNTKSPATESFFYNTYDGSKGISFKYNTSTSTTRYSIYGDTTTGINISIDRNSWNLMVLVVDRGTSRLQTYANGVAGTSGTPPVGTYATSTFSIGADTVPTYLIGSISRIQVFVGSGIGAFYTDAYAKYHATSIFGLRPKSSKIYPMFTRTGSIFSPVGSDTFAIGANTPRSNPVKGVALAPALTNKCYKNFGLVSGDEDYITISGGMTKTTTTVTLETYGIYGGSGRVYSVTNSTGSDGYITSGALTATLDKRSVSVRAHHTSGSGCRVGLYGDGTWTDGVAISNSFVRSHALVIPDDTDQQWAIKIPTATTIQFIMQNNVLSPIIAPEIPNLATATSASIGTSSISWGVNMPNSCALIEAEIAPDGWSTTADAATRTVVTDSISSGRHMEINATTQQVVIHDGTNDAVVAITEADGVYQTVRTSYGSRGLVAEVAGVQNRDSYDGAIGAGIATTNALNRWLRRLSIFKRER